MTRAVREPDDDRGEIIERFFFWWGFEMNEMRWRGHTNDTIEGTSSRPCRMPVGSLGRREAIHAAARRDSARVVPIAALLLKKNEKPRFSARNVVFTSCGQLPRDP